MRTVTGEVTDRDNGYRLILWDNLKDHYVGAATAGPPYSNYNGEWTFTQDRHGLYTIRRDGDDGMCLTAIQSAPAFAPAWGSRTAAGQPEQDDAETQRWEIQSVGVPGKPNIVTISPVSSDGEKVLTLMSPQAPQAYTVTLANRRDPDDGGAKKQHWKVPKRVLGILSTEIGD